MPRKATGQLFRVGTRWWARYWATVEGERIRVRRDLETDLRAVAVARLARLLAGATPATVTASETFEAATVRVIEQRRRDGVASSEDELARLERFAFPTLAPIGVADIEARHINEALDACKTAGKSRQTCVHLRQAIRNVFEALRREGVINTNPVDSATMPRFPTTVRKERAVLTDDELAVYLAYSHPLKQHRMPVLQRQTMACVARCFGGLRTGDLHALDWSAFDVGHGAFEWGWAPRRKTKRPQLLEVPELLRGILRDWWERHGRPTTGPVFPARRGARAGERKGKVSHALAFRRDLQRAFGVEEWDTSSGQFRVTRELTLRERELFEETPYTLPVDFHSWRRAFTQALGDADVNAQQATALAGHASLAAHARYLASSGKLRRVPAAALPAALPSPTPFRPERGLNPIRAESPSAQNRSWAGQDSNLRHPACKASALPTELPARLGNDRAALAARRLLRGRSGERAVAGLPRKGATQARSTGLQLPAQLLAQRRSRAELAGHGRPCPERVRAGERAAYCGTLGMSSPELPGRPGGTPRLDASVGTS
jgi:integrase